MNVLTYGILPCLLCLQLVASKYLYDDGEEDEVFNDEWATSAAITLQDLNQAELEFLTAIVSNVNSFIPVVKHIQCFLSA